MAHKKIHPAQGNSPPIDHDRTLNPPGPKPAQDSAGAAPQEQDPKRRMGAFALAGDHARQQQMGNKD